MNVQIIEKKLLFSNSKWYTSKYKKYLQSKLTMNNKTEILY